MKISFLFSKLFLHFMLTAISELLNAEFLLSSIFMTVLKALLYLFEDPLLKLSTLFIFPSYSKEHLGLAELSMPLTDSPMASELFFSVTSWMKAS